jgi:ribonuclease BN (tRNA processing enzyme)
MRLEVLGCSGGIGGALRTTALLVDHDVLIDAGTGVTDLSLDRLAQINHVFLTHSHLDHIAAIPWMVDTVGSARTQPLVVHALDATIRTLKDHIFNWRIWPDFTRIPNPEHPYLRFESMTTGAEINLAGRIFVAFPANHVVPTVGYRIDSGRQSLIFSGDTASNDSLWQIANQCGNLGYLLIETAFSNRDRPIADASKHLYPNQLAMELKKFTGSAEIYITHMKPGEEEEIMAEIAVAVSSRTPKRLTQGQIFKF